MRRTRWRRSSWALAGLLGMALAAGCTHGADPGKGAPSSSSRLSGTISPGRTGNEKATQYDLNHDGKPDVWDYTVPTKGPDGKDTTRLVRKELDINFDGRVDIVRSYDVHEQLEKEMLDLDFDGKVDQVNAYEKGMLVRKERDLGARGHPDEWVYYEKGKIVRKEKDLNGDGKVDYWEYWENDQVDRVGEDLDGDGKIDRWTKNPNGTAANNGG